MPRLHRDRRQPPVYEQRIDREHEDYIALSEGSGVFAADTGTVTFAGWNIYGYGNLIVINHGNGFETFYGHLSAINVFPGQIVYQGNVIGAVGNTGRSSGPHIHFEIRTNGNQDDPCWYIGC